MSAGKEIPITAHPASPSLTETLRLRRVASLLDDATLIRDHGASDERLEAGQQLVREAMREQSLGRLSLDEQDRILSLLSFAVAAMRRRIDSNAADALTQHPAEPSQSGP